MTRNYSKSTREFILRQKLKNMGYSNAVVDKYANDLIKKFNIDLSASLKDLYKQINKLANSPDFNQYMNAQHSVEYGPDAQKPRIFPPAPEPKPTAEPDAPRTRPLPKPSPYNN